MADEKIHELNDAKAKAETEAEQALETAVTAEGVDETLASSWPARSPTSPGANRRIGYRRRL